jgi:hypothetical protein
MREGGRRKGGVAGVMVMTAVMTIRFTGGVIVIVVAVGGGGGGELW